MQEQEIDNCLKIAQDVARQAGKVIMEAFDAEKRVETKHSVADLVTETDQQVERMIMCALKTHCPTYGFIGEETVAAEGHCELSDNNPTWIVDPIDGTSNFVHRFPFTCVSIGLVFEKQPVVGVVYLPVKDEMYTARVGQGAFCNGKRLAVSKTTELSHALVCAEFGSGRDPKELDLKLQNMRRVVDASHGIRCIGSAACAMVQVAGGHADAYFEAGIHCWDIAAAWLIVREAGGVVLDISGGPLDLMSRRVLCAGTEQLALQLTPKIQAVPYARD